MGLILVVAGAAAFAFLIWGDHAEWPKGWDTALGWAAFFAITAGTISLTA